MNILFFMWSWSFVSCWVASFTWTLKYLVSNVMCLMSCGTGLTVLTYCLLMLIYEIMSSSSVNIHDIGIVWNNAFCHMFNCCWRESVKPLQYFCTLLIPYWWRSFNIFFGNFWYIDNIVLRTLVALPAVYYEYISLCSKYDIKDPLSSQMYIKNHVFKAFCASVF